MKYIIMCGGNYPGFEKPRQMMEINGEPIVARTIRLLREAGIDDIAISTNDLSFKKFGVTLLHHKNEYRAMGFNVSAGQWCDCFYPTAEPACYLFGDVFFSPEAIRTIVGYKTDDVMLFGSRAPFAEEYPKPFREPFAFKVADQDHLRRACEQVRALDRRGEFRNRPIAWELWSVLTGYRLNKVNNNYVTINDYTCDIDYPMEVELLEAVVPK